MGNNPAFNQLGAVTNAREPILCSLTAKGGM
jgi:hypothetical protein